MELIDPVKLSAALKPLADELVDRLAIHLLELADRLSTNLPPKITEALEGLTITVTISRKAS